jgi:hypothetical protein
MQNLLKAITVVTTLAAAHGGQAGEAPQIRDWTSPTAEEAWLRLARDSTIVVRATVVASTLRVLRPRAPLPAEQDPVESGAARVFLLQDPWVAGTLLRVRLAELYKGHPGQIGNTIDIYQPADAAIAAVPGAELVLFLENPIRLDARQEKELGGRRWSRLEGTYVVDPDDPFRPVPFNARAAYRLTGTTGAPAALGYTPGDPKMLAVLAAIRAQEPTPAKGDMAYRASCSSAIFVGRVDARFWCEWPERKRSHFEPLPSGEVAITLPNPSDYVAGHVYRIRVAEVLMEEGRLAVGAALDLLVPGWSRGPRLEESRDYLVFAKTPAHRRARGSLAGTVLSRPGSPPLPFDDHAAYELAETVLMSIDGDFTAASLFEITPANAAFIEAAKEEIRQDAEP